MPTLPTLPTFPTQTLVRALLAAALITPLAMNPAHADEAALLQKIEKLATELEQLKQELMASKKKTEAVEQRQNAADQARATPPAAPATPSGTAPTHSAGASAPQAATVLSGYGEINYSRPTHASDRSSADVTRAVLGVSHRFDDRTKLVGEFEWEHAVVSKDDNGEAAVEQLYVEHELAGGLKAKAGLYLIPVGLLNTSHEPTAYYGVTRNFVETAIIPSTWREVGLGLSKTHDNGLSWDAGITTGFDLSKWDADSDEGREEGPLASIHQEGQQAKSRDLSVHLALNWRGVPGLLLGGSVFTGKAGHKTPGFAANDARITLWDLHARYTPGQWDLQALATRGTISNTEALNLTFAGKASPVPSSFYGWYVQGAYHLWRNERYRLTPFARYEKFNTAQNYRGQLPGLGLAGAEAERVSTLGASFTIGEGVVLKADYQKFKLARNNDRFNLGIGYSF
jgi:hypothetical protein